MLVDLPDFSSENRLADLPFGRYAVIESMYQLADPPCHAILTELLQADRQHAVAADLQVVLADREMLFRDFAVAPDGAWRDSYGATAASLGELLPMELADFLLVSRRKIDIEHDGAGRLSMAIDEA